MKKILKLFSGLLLALGLAACSNDFTIAEKLLKDDHTHTSAPTFSIPAGAVTSGTEVTITCTTEGAKIYYTTDGSTPTASSTEYTAAISVTEAVTIKAIAVKDGMNNSVVASVSYTIKFLGTKAPDVAKAEGDIVFNDGSATSYTDGLNLSNEQKGAAIAVIFKVDGGKALGVGLKHSTGDLAWCTTDAGAFNNNIGTIQCLVSGGAGNLSFTVDTDGSDNLEQIALFLTDAGQENDTTVASKYPAFYFAKNYKTTATNLGAAYENDWYLPTVAELFDIWKVKATVEAASSLCGGSQFGNNFYWSSSQYASDVCTAYLFYFSNGDRDSDDKDNDGFYVCAVRAFN